MDELSKDRATWLAEHVLPEEEMLRKWLAKRPLAGLDPDDIIQETYAILAALESVAHIVNPRSYMFQIAHSVVHAHFRRSRIVEFRSVADADYMGLASDAPSPERVASDREFLKEVEHYLDQLPRNCRDVLLLRRVRQLSHAAIAQQLGISTNSVEKLLAKAAHLLMKAFGRGGSRSVQISNERDAGEFKKHNL